MTTMITGEMMIRAQLVLWVVAAIGLLLMWLDHKLHG